MRIALRRSLHAVALALLWISTYPLAGGADLLSSVAAATKPQEETPASVRPLSPRDIATRADADERFAQEVARRAAERSRADDRARELLQLEQGVWRLTERMRRDDISTLPAIRIASVQRNWEFYDRQLRLWRRELQRRVDADSIDAADLAVRREVWQATRAASRDQFVPALVERVDEVLRALDAADRALSVPLGRDLDLGQRGNLVQATIDAGQRTVNTASEQFNRRLGHIDAPPLWVAWQEPRMSQSALAIAANGFALERDFLRSYIKASRDRLWLQAALAVLLIPVLAWLRARSRRVVAGDLTLEASTQVLTRPVSAWLVLVLVATLFLQSYSPILLHEAAVLLAAIPVLRLLPKQVYDLLRAWPYAVTALYVLQRLTVLLVAQPLWHRVYLLELTVLALGTIAWVLLPALRRTSRAQASRIQRLARAFGALGMFTLAVSAVANVVGNVSLATVLTGATLDSGYLGLVLYAGATVLSSMVRLLLPRRKDAQFVMVRQAGPLLETIGKLIELAALSVWVIITLYEFHVYRPVADAIRGVLTYPLTLGQISLTLGSVLLFLVSVYLAFWLAKTIRVALEQDVLTKMSLPRGVANSVATLSYYALIVVGLLIALAAAGFEVGQFAIVIGALGVGIGFGLQNVVNNFVSGLILMFERPIQPGDVVEITGTTGTVREIGMRATTLTTGDGADVVVPNGTLLSEKLVNWTLSDRTRRFSVEVGVAYGTDPKRVLSLLTETAVATPGVAPFPTPAATFKGFGASSLDFTVGAWTNDFNDWAAIRSNLGVRIHDALTSAGIQIPYPQRDVRILGPAPDVPPARKEP